MISRGRLFLYRLIFGLVLLAFWELSSGRLIDPFWVSSPSKVFRLSLRSVRRRLDFRPSGDHAVRNLHGLFHRLDLRHRPRLCPWGAAKFWRRFSTPTSSLLTAFRASPWRRCSSSGSVSVRLRKLFSSISVVFFLTFFNTFAGVKGVDAELKNVLRIMGATERQILMKVTLPAIVPWITTGLKISLPYAIVAAVVGEFIAASKGLGYLINYNTSLFSTTGALGGILILALVVVVCNEAITRPRPICCGGVRRDEKNSESELY